MTPLHILSLGAGVQSSTVALMAAAGEITPMPTVAIFADTKAEPISVYKWLDWLEKQLPFPVQRVTAGDLAETSTRIRTSGRSKLDYLSHAVPAYTLTEDGEKGTWFRQCTDKHKLTPLKNAISKHRGEREAVVWIGISVDEAVRMKSSHVKGVLHRFPLIELGMTRKDCLEWMAKRGLPTPPRSSCSFCPYHSDREWRRLKDNEPEAFADAVNYEKAIQASALKIDRLDGVPFLHPKRIPLSEVDFSTDTERGQGLLAGFNNECEGMCGV